MMIPKKVTLGFALVLAVMSMTAKALTPDEEAAILVNLTDGLSVSSSSASVSETVATFVSQYPEMASAIVDTAIKSSPASVAYIVEGTTRSLKSSTLPDADVASLIADIAGTASKASLISAPAVTRATVTAEPTATLDIVQSISREIQTALNNGILTGQQSEDLLRQVEAIAFEIASANGIELTNDDIIAAVNAGSIDALNLANPTAAGIENAPDTTIQTPPGLVNDNRGASVGVSQS